MPLLQHWRERLFTGMRTRRQVNGAAAEQAAWDFLTAQGLQGVARNFRCKGGEIDLIMQDRGTLVFVEVRQRSSTAFGGAVASVTRAKQKRLLLAAQLFLQRYRQPPPCRFDVIAYDGGRMSWLQNAVEAGPEAY